MNARARKAAHFGPSGLRQTCSPMVRPQRGNLPVVKETLHLITQRS